MKLPQQVTQTFFVHLNKYDAGRFDLWQHDMSDHGRACLGEVSVTFDIPQGVDPIEAQVDVLNKELQAVNAEYSAKVARINTQIKELQALTYEPAL